MSTLPTLSSAAQNNVDGHETPTSGVVPSMFVSVQNPPPPAGLADVATFPAPSTATQSDVDGQDGADSPAGSTCATFHEAAPPIGVRTFPLASVITQRELEGPAMPESEFQPSTRGVVVQAAEPPVGAVDVITSLPSTATQSAVDAHE